MSGQDEKWMIIDAAREKYQALIGILQRAGNPTLPESLAKAIADYEKLGAVVNSMKFDSALREWWRRIYISTELRPKLELIANEEGPDIFEPNAIAYWERWRKSIE